MKEPRMGEIVSYNARIAVYPAMIIGKSGDLYNIIVFTQAGIFNKTIPFSEKREPEHWFYPEPVASKK